MRILITGGAGAIATMMRTRLTQAGRVLRLFDVAAMDEPDSDLIETWSGDLSDPDAVAAATMGCDAVIHLGAIPVEDTWEAINRINVQGTHNVIAAAQRHGIQQVILASSNHAVGFNPRTPGLPDDCPVRPDTYYGYSKAAGEALGSLFSDRYGMNVFAVRIGWCTPEPVNEFALPIWLSPDDAARLFEACLTTQVRGFRRVWGASRNSRRYWSYAGGDEIGYDPHDDSEAYAGRDLRPDGDDVRDRLGGAFTTAPLGVPMGDDNPS